MQILVIDGQGGGMGKTLVERLKSRIGQMHKVMAVGTNSVATSAMLKAGADSIATGENAVKFNAKRADIIMGSLGIIAANSMMGELTPDMAEAISESDAVKILIPLKKCGLNVAGVKDISLPELIDEAVDMALDTIKMLEERKDGHHCGY